MVHVLRQIHRTLRPEGILLDVHPMPRATPVGVRRAGVWTPVGVMGDTYSEVVHAARARLAPVVRRGAFRVQARRWFDLEIRFDSVDEWLAHRREQGSVAPIPPGIRPRARSLMRAQGATLVFAERIRATALKRGPRWVT